MRRARWPGTAAALLAIGLAAGCTGDSPDSAAGNSTVGGSGNVTAVSEPVATPGIVPAAQRWWDDDTFYEIFVRSFKDSDGDGIGDLRGIIDQLDYLNDGDPATTNDLGVTGIWLMPVFPSPSYHGYDVTDYRDVNPQYGALDDLKELLAQADARGISVILDLPLNHTSDQHPWFQSSMSQEDGKSDWYEWIDGQSDETGPWGQQLWHPSGGRSYLGLFTPTMPDLNLRNPEVTAELEDVARFWLDLGVDGFRLDAAQHLVEQDGEYANTPDNAEWLSSFNAFVKGVDPDALLVGEVWSDSITSSEYVPGQSDLTFDFTSADSAATLATIGDADRLLTAAEDDLDNYPEGQVAVFTDNHDRNRNASLAFDDPDRLRLLATWLLTQPGVPFLYYGQEIGLPGVKPDEQIRTPMPWSDASPAAGFTTGEPWEDLQGGWEATNVATQQADPDSLWNHYARLIAARNASPALRTGSFETLEVSDDAGFAYLRTLGDEQVIVLGNAGRAPIDGLTITLPEESSGTWTSLLGQQIAQPTGTAFTPVADLAPWETAIVRLGG